MSKIAIIHRGCDCVQEYPNESSRNPLVELISEFSNFTYYKVQIKTNSFYMLAT